MLRIYTCHKGFLEDRKTRTCSDEFTDLFTDENTTKKNGLR